MSLLVATLMGAAIVNALSARQNITPLSTFQIDSFTSYTYFASAAYCTAAQTLAWNCGSMSPSMIALTFMVLAYASFCSQLPSELWFLTCRIRWRRGFCSIL